MTYKPSEPHIGSFPKNQHQPPITRSSIRSRSVKAKKIQEGEIATNCICKDWLTYSDELHPSNHLTILLFENCIHQSTHCCSFKSIILRAYISIIQQQWRRCSVRSLVAAVEVLPLSTAAVLLLHEHHHLR